MTTPLQDQQLESFVPVYDVIPDDWQSARQFLVELLKKICNAVNVREIGWLLDEELISGKQFIPGSNIPEEDSPRQFRTVLRKVIDFGALPNAVAKSVPHGITFDSNFTLIDMYAAATDPVGLSAVPIIYASPLSPSIQLSMDATNVTIVTAANLTNYTRCFVVIEYIQEL